MPTVQQYADKTIQVANRREEAMRLRRAGWHVSDIARHLKVDVRTVNADISFEFQKLRESTVEYALDIRDLDLQRLDEIWQGLQDGIRAGDPAACQAALRVLDRRAKIFGYDAAAKVDLNVGIVTAEEASKMSDAALKEMILQMAVEAGVSKALSDGSDNKEADGATVINLKAGTVIKNVTPKTKSLGPAPDPGLARVRHGDIIEG